MRILGFLTALLCMSVAWPGHAHAQNECIPQCRSGYTCIDSKCVSECNPTCEAGARCSDGGQCVAPMLLPARGHQALPKLRVSLSTGLVFPSTVYTDEKDFDTQLGAAARLSLDRPITEGFSMGLYSNVISTTTEDDEASVIGLGLTFKTSIPLTDVLTLRFGLGLGYQMSSAGSIDDVVGLDVAPIIDVVGKLSSTSTIIVTLMGFSQPAGGNKDSEVTWYPIPTLLVGLEWSL